MPTWRRDAPSTGRTVTSLFTDIEGSTPLDGAVDSEALIRVRGVMMAPVIVLHLPDPREFAIEALGRERADAVLATGAAMPLGDLVAEVVALPASSRAIAAGTGSACRAA